MGDLVSGSFRILGELRDAARPGMRLAHSLVTGELVVLALPDPTGAGPSADELRQEGSIFGEIVSPYIHTIVDWNPELPFVAWEYMTAWPLSSALRNAPQPEVSTVLAAMQELALGLAAVHARGAVYRGLHPGRIMVMRDGSTRLDTTADAVLVAHSLTNKRPLRGVPIPYVAPEQFDGVFDTRSDLYALGAVAYELLTGHRLVADLDPVTQAAIIQQGTTVAPSAYRSGIPEAVDNLFATLLARDPANRIATALELAENLQRLEEGTPAPDAEPLAAFLAIQPVIAPLLAEDVAESEMYAALHAPPPARLDGASAPRRPHRAYRSAADRAGSAEAIGPGRQGCLVAAGGEVFALNGPRAVIGRRGGQGEAPGVDLADLDEGKVVSREHAVLDLGEDRWYLSEMSARNGTWLNGERVRKGSFLRLRRGDQIRVASLHLSYVVADAEAGDAAADEAPMDGLRQPMPAAASASAESP